MDQTMPPLNLFDGMLLAAALAVVVIGCSKGLVKELIHTVFFTAAAVAATLYIVQHPTNASPTETTLTLAAYLAGAYIGIMLIMRFILPFLMKTEDKIGLRSRLSGGALALLKLIAVGLFINVWFAAHSTESTPERLEALPEMMQNSSLVQGSDEQWAEPIYQALLNTSLIQPPAGSSSSADTTSATTPGNPTQTPDWE